MEFYVLTLGRILSVERICVGVFFTTPNDKCLPDVRTLESVVFRCHTF